MFRLILLLIIFITSCKKYDKNTDIFIDLLAREEYLKEIDPSRVFNPSPAMVITTLPNNIGSTYSTYEINDFEIIKNGLGYSKRYKNRKIKNGYWIDIFSYHNTLNTVPTNINNDLVKNAYNKEKQFILTTYQNSKILENNFLTFTSPSGKNINMYETVFEYWNLENKTKLKMFLYFGTIQDSFYKIRITYKIDSNEAYIFKDKELFLKDIAYYFMEGMSLNDFNKFKKAKLENLTTIKRKQQA